MTVYELIQKLAKFPAEAPVHAIVSNQPEDFTITWGGPEGCPAQRAEDVGIYVDRWNESEQPQ